MKGSQVLSLRELYDFMRSLGVTERSNVHPSLLMKYFEWKALATRNKDFPEYWKVDMLKFRADLEKQEAVENADKGGAKGAA